MGWLPYAMTGSVIFVKYMVLWAMIYYLASVQLCDALFSYTMEIDKYAAECAHCYVYYLLSSNVYPESAWFLSESRSQITTVSILISSSWGYRKQVLPPSPTLTGTTDAPKMSSICILCSDGPLVSSLVTRKSQISLRRTSHRGFPGNGGKWCLRMR